MVSKQVKKTKTTKSAGKLVQSRAKKKAPTTVDYSPNRMTEAVSALAGTVIVLFALIAVLGL